MLLILAKFFKIQAEVPALLHVCQQSRALAQSIYVDVGQRGLFDSARDKLLIFENGYGLIMLWCEEHNQSTTSEWSHVRHVVYFAHEIHPRHLRVHIAYLWGLFVRQQAGKFVETISIVTHCKLSEKVWDSLEQAWKDEGRSEIRLIQANGTDIGRQAEQCLDGGGCGSCSRYPLLD